MRSIIPNPRNSIKTCSHQRIVILATAYFNLVDARQKKTFHNFNNLIPIPESSKQILSKTSRPATPQTARPKQTEPQCRANRHEPAITWTEPALLAASTNRTEPNRNVARTETNRPFHEPNRPCLRFPRTETNLNEPKPSSQSTCGSESVQNIPGSDHFWELKCRKSARRCGAKQIWTWKCTKHTMFGPLLEVAMPKKCTALWREAHFESKIYLKKNHSDHFWTSRYRPAAEKAPAFVARSPFPSPKC